MKRAAVMLIIKDGLILGVSRPNDDTKFGLAGGKIETNETPKEAAIRETKEETSIEVAECVEIFKHKEKNDYETHCFYATKWSGEPKEVEKSKVKWLTGEELIYTKAAFGEYNKEAIKRLQEKFPDVKIKFSKSTKQSIENIKNKS